MPNYNRIPDIYRKESIESLFNTRTFNNCWNTWKEKINEFLPERYTENDILNLGDHLTEIFRTTSTEGRGQGELSGGGAAWESLVCWYINLCTVGSRIVAIKKMSLVPIPIQNSFTVNYGNFACNTESDITIVIFPNKEEYNNGIDSVSMNDSSGKLIPIVKREKLNINLLNHLCREQFGEYEIGIIQCKTNWNDNAQIPMLWDMIYSANGFRSRNITIGREGFNIHDASNFTYSFVTVPSNQNARYNSESVAVKRVTNLSGGNYWGKGTESNIARSLKEIFTNNFQNGFRNSIRNDIKAALPYFNNELSYFQLH